MIKNRSLTIVVVFLLTLVVLAWVFIAKQLEALSPGESWAIRQTLAYPVVGNLGGVPVSIPKPYAKFVEYDDDPHFMEARKSPPPPRTYQSPLRSFGFDIRFPDMQPVTDQNYNEFRKASIQTTMWMRVGIASNSIYGFDGDHAMARYAQNILADVARTFHYEKLPRDTYGLVGYTPVNADLSRRELGKGFGGPDMLDYNVYFHQDSDGEVDAYIKCWNMTHLAERCEHRFLLTPEMRTEVTVGYRSELLPHWREIQSSVTKVMLGFRVTPQAKNPSN